MLQEDALGGKKRGLKGRQQRKSNIATIVAQSLLPRPSVGHEVIRVLGQGG